MKKETKANGLGPNPQYQLSKTKSVKDKLNTHFIAEIVSLHNHESLQILSQELRVYYLPPKFESYLSPFSALFNLKGSYQKIPKNQMICPILIQEKWSVGSLGLPLAWLPFILISSRESGGSFGCLQELRRWSTPL